MNNEQKNENTMFLLPLILRYLYIRYLDTYSKKYIKYRSRIFFVVFLLDFHEYVIVITVDYKL